MGRPACGAGGGIRWAYQAGTLGQAPPISPSSPGLLPEITTTQWSLVNAKEPCNLWGNYLFLHERKQRGEGTFSRPPSQEIQGQNLNPGVQAPSLGRMPVGLS